MVSIREVFRVALTMKGQGVKYYIRKRSRVQFLSYVYQTNNEFFVMSRIITYSLIRQKFTFLLNIFLYFESKKMKNAKSCSYFIFLTNNIKFENNRILNFSLSWEGKLIVY